MESNTPQPRPEQPADRGTGPIDEAAVRLAELLMIKPKWRGWIHTVTAPLALAAGLVLVLLAPTPDLKIACAVYAFTGVLLFGISAIYHRGNWSPRVKIVLKRLDHTNIMLVIAGSYTPLAWALLDRPKAELLLWVIWSGASWAYCSGCCGPTPRAGSTCRSTSPWAAARFSTCRTYSQPMWPRRC